MVFFIIVIVLAIAAFVITYFVMQTEDTADKNIANIDSTKISTQSITAKFILDGTWASYNDGAMLTIKGQSFTIELPSVESSEVTSGKIIIVDKTATFVYTYDDSNCGIKPGKYEFKILNNGEVTFKKLDDHCNSRSMLLVATWFKV